MTAWRASGIVLSCFVGLLCLAYGATSASAHSRYIFTGSFGIAGSGAGQLSLAAGSGAAVNSQTHDVYVADTQNNRIDEFEANGTFVRAWGWGVNAKEPKEELQSCTVATGCQKGLSGSAPGEFEVPTYVAVDNSPSGEGDVYVADTGDSLVSKFDKEGKLIESWGIKGQLDGSNSPEGLFSEIDGIAVDTSGRLWIAVQNTVYEFGQEGSYVQSLTPFPFAYPKDIAIDGSDNLYFDFGEEVLRISSSGSAIGGRIIHGHGPSYFSVTGIAADPATNNIFIEVGGLVERFASSCETVGEYSEGCIPLESFGPPQSAGESGLTVDSATGIVYILKSGSDLIEAFTPEVPQPPIVESESASMVTSDSATFSAKINPNGPKTSYRVEYGLSASYGDSVPIPDGLVGSGFEVQEFSPHVQELEAQTTYHFRVVSYNEKGTTYGEDRTFTTQLASTAFESPDGRKWELVTPAEKRGALFFGQNYASLHGVVPDPLVGEASVNGDAMVDLASAPTEAEPGGYVKEVSVLSTRGSDGWSSTVIAPPHEHATGAYLSHGGEYEFFSEDLSRGIVDPFGPFTPLSPEASESTPYLHTNFVNGDIEELCGSSCDRPLVTAADTQGGVRFGGEVTPGAGCPDAICGPAFVDATPDASYVVVSSQEQLTTAPNERAEGQGPFYYEWGDAQLQPLYLLPASEGGSGVYAGKLSSARHQFSEDGSVFFAYKEHLYVHDFKKDESVRLDVAQGLAEPTAGGATFLYASSDGSRVLFSDSKPLTGAGESGIYECRIVETGRLPACELELTSMSGGTLIGGSKDASYLYFEDATGHLVTDHYNDDEWTTTSGPYIGTLPESRTPIAGFPAGVSISEVSSNGRWLTFMSEEELTGYDNHDAVSGFPDVEVYLYNVASNKLVCASCDPTGGRPVGTEVSQHDLVAGSLAEKTSTNSPRWAAANLPPWTKSTQEEDRYQPRFLDDSGRLFFDSHDALASQDVNGGQDVYEYEPPGVGSCTTGSAGFSERSDGCLGLISSGASSEESAFMDASGSGGDAFFITLSKLTSQDFDSALDVYDAHECTAQSPCPAPVASVPPACSTGDACKAAPSPQPSIFGAPSSATFSGAGNVVAGNRSLVSKAKTKPLSKAQKLKQALRACAKKRRGQRAVCERVARKRYGKVADHGKRG